MPLGGEGRRGRRWLAEPAMRPESSTRARQEEAESEQAPPPQQAQTTQEAGNRRRGMSGDGSDRRTQEAR